jgi:hypothetical protein
MFAYTLIEALSFKGGAGFVNHENLRTLRMRPLRLA